MMRCLAVCMLPRPATMSTLSKPSAPAVPSLRLPNLAAAAGCANLPSSESESISMPAPAEPAIEPICAAGAFCAGAACLARFSCTEGFALLLFSARHTYS